MINGVTLLQLANRHDSGERSASFQPNQSMSTTALTIAPQESQSLALIREAMSNGADPAYLKELLAVKLDWEAAEAKKDYFQAIAAFQSRAPIIEKADKAYDKMYARMDRIWRTVKPLMTELGLSCTWQVGEVRDKFYHVEGQLAHANGHAVPLVMDVAIPELLKGQNVAQQTGSARTYAQRYAFCAALGIQTGEDDDAHGVTPRITTAMADGLVAILRQFGKSWEAERDSVLGWRNVDSITDLPITDFELVRNTIQRKLDKASKP
jgi:hypothetical protein